MNKELIKLAYKAGHDKAINDFTKSAGLMKWLGFINKNAPVYVGGAKAPFAGAAARSARAAAAASGAAAPAAAASPKGWRKAWGGIKNIWTSWRARRAAARAARTAQGANAAQRNAEAATHKLERQLAGREKELERMTGRANTLAAQRSDLFDMLRASKNTNKILGGTTAAAILAGLYGMNRQEINNLREWKHREGDRVDQFARRFW